MPTVRFGRFSITGSTSCSTAASFCTRPGQANARFAKALARLLSGNDADLGSRLPSYSPGCGVAAVRIRKSDRFFSIYLSRRRTCLSPRLTMENSSLICSNTTCWISRPRRTL